MKKDKCGGCSAGWWLIVLGALNWGLMGLFEYNLVEAILGGWPWLVRLIYVFIGLAALLMLASAKGMCKMCKK